MEIVTYPNPVLRAPTEPVTVFDDELRAFTQEMAELMVKSDGVGLAAPQVGVSKQIVVIDRYAFEGEEGSSKPKVVLINPEVIAQSKATQTGDEGCLSFPGVFVRITRPESVRVRAQDVDGNSFEIEGTGLGARALLHEIGHLHGNLLTDNVSFLVRTRALKKLQRNLAALKNADKEEK